MASQPEGSTPSSPLGGWTFFNSDSESEFSNSDSIEELFEQNRLHLTVNPLDPFLPTIRPTNNLPYDPMVPFAPQIPSPQPDSDNHDPAAETDPGHSGNALPALNTAAPDTEFRLEDYLEDGLFGDFDFPLAGNDATTQEPVFNFEYMADDDNHDFHDVDLGLDGPADEEVAPGENHTQAVPDLPTLDTFDPDFWFYFETGVDPESPRPTNVFDNTRSSIYSRAPEEAQLQPQSMSSLADVYGYSELMAQLGPNSPPLCRSAHSFPIPPDQELPSSTLPEPLPVGMFQIPQVMQQELPELNFTYNPVVDSEREMSTFPQTRENPDITTPSDFSVTESGSTAASAPISGLPIPTPRNPEPLRHHNQQWYVEGARRQRKAAARFATRLRRQRLGQRQENHQQHREQILEDRQGVSESRPPLRPLHPLLPAIPRSVPAQQPPLVGVIPAPVVNPGPMVSWYRREQAHTGALLGYVRRVEQFYTHLPPIPSSVVHNPVRAPVVFRLPAGGPAIHVPLAQRGPAPLSTPTMPPATAVERETRDVIVVSDSDADTTSRPRISPPMADSPPDHSEPTPAIAQKPRAIIVIDDSDSDDCPARPLRRSRRLRFRARRR